MSAADWDLRWMNMAKLVASWSKDRSTQVGCVVVSDTNHLLTIGYNGFPHGSNDDDDARHERPAKYLWSEHAERNAIYSATRTGSFLVGARIYVTPLHPCADCARAIVQSGITEICCPPANYSIPQWADSFKVAEEILKEAHIWRKVWID